MKKIKNYREQSKLLWGIETEKNITESQITLGCILRIADALDEIKKPYVDMIIKLKNGENEIEWYRAELKKYRHREARLKGHITRLENLRKVR